MLIFELVSIYCLIFYLIILQQYKAEVELGEGQLQVLNVSVFASLLL